LSLLCDLITLPLPDLTSFPYTTLFRSRGNQKLRRVRAEGSAVDAPAVRSAERRADGRADPSRTRRLHVPAAPVLRAGARTSSVRDRKSTRLNSSHQIISYAVFCLKKTN